MATIGTRTQNCFSRVWRSGELKIGALAACPFPAGTLIICRAIYLFVHCAHFIALSMSFHYTIFTAITPYDTVFIVRIL